VLYTDGLTDAMDAGGERFGEEKLEAAVRAQIHGTPDQCADAVFDAVAVHRAGCKQVDDETIVVIDRI
jgi:sigma-B regulation protein RsbU (phosphoserine phosphatase)